jgi:hypothetical protein
MEKNPIKAKKKILSPDQRSMDNNKPNIKRIHSLFLIKEDPLLPADRMRDI